MNCPHCKKTIPDEVIASEAARLAGASGRGMSKRRTTEQARAAARARWANHRRKHGIPNPPTP